MEEVVEEDHGGRPPKGVQQRPPRRRKKRSEPAAYRTATLFFDALPHEIRLLRDALGWSRFEMGRVLQLYVDPVRVDCPRIRSWERGLSRPLPVFRSKLLMLVEGCYSQMWWR